MKRKRIIYLHGFGSSSQSGTIQTLRELLPDYKVIAPDIPVDPADALPYLLELCKYVKPDVVIGTSMGGMYAQQMCGFKRICVNPAFEMSVKSKMLKVGTFEYFKPRKDGATHFTITPKIIENFARMEERQFAGARDDQDGQVWGLFGSNDKQVNCEEIFRRYYSNVIHFDGEHRMNDVVIRDVLVPLIQKLANSDDIILDTPRCKAYGHLMGYDLYITTASSTFVLPEDMSYAFYGLTRLQEIWGLERWDTSHVTNMSHMFEGVTVEYLDLSGFDTSNATNMESMFEYSGEFDNRFGHFYCREHHELDLRNFVTDRVVKMDMLFEGTRYDVIRLGDWSLAEVREECPTWGNTEMYGEPKILDVRAMSIPHLEAFIRLAKYNHENLLCSPEQVQWWNSDTENPKSEMYPLFKIQSEC